MLTVRQYASGQQPGTQDGEWQGMHDRRR
jgi:hypothetical protein